MTTATPAVGIRAKEGAPNCVDEQAGHTTPGHRRDDVAAFNQENSYYASASGQSRPYSTWKCTPL